MFKFGFLTPRIELGYYLRVVKVRLWIRQQRSDLLLAFLKCLAVGLRISNIFVVILCTSHVWFVQFHVFLSVDVHFRIKMHPVHFLSNPCNCSFYCRTCFCIYKVVQMWPGLFVCKQVTVCPDHIWTTLYYNLLYFIYCSMYRRFLDRVLVSTPSVLFSVSLFF
jgi:hypothetical protein